MQWRRTRIHKYTAVGIGLLILDWIVFWLARHSGLGLPSAQFLARSAGAFAGFFLHKHFSFSCRDYCSATLRRNATGYLVLTFASIAISSLMVAGFSTFTKNAFLAKLLHEPVMLLINYSTMKIIYLKKNEH